MLNVKVYAYGYVLKAVHILGFTQVKEQAEGHSFCSTSLCNMWVLLIFTLFVHYQVAPFSWYFTLKLY